MSAIRTIRMTLTGPYRGQNKTLNKFVFIDGVHDFTGSKEEIEGVILYFTRSFQVEVSEPGTEAVATEPDNSDPPIPNARQAEIIEAINCIEKDNWVDLQAKTPRPKVKDVQMLASDPTITRTEIVEAIVTWLS